MENKETVIPTKEKDLEVKDDNPSTFINENLWLKFLFKFLGYFTYVCATSIIMVPIIGWSWVAFVIGLRTIVLPLVWSALDAQSRNKEIQARLELENKIEENKDIIDELKQVVSEQKIEINVVKTDLDAKCIELEANRKALDTTKIEGEITPE